MIPLFDGLRSLASDALVAVARSLQEARTGFSEYEAGDYLLAGSGRMESDGPDAADADADVLGAAVAFGVLDQLPDSALLRMAAHVIDGWKPILLLRDEVLAATDLDEFIGVLWDRAAQFEVVELDADEPLPSSPGLRWHAADDLPPFRGK